MQRWLILVLFSLLQWSAYAAILKNIALNGAEKGTVHLDLILDHHTQAKVFALSHPDRVVIDLPGTRVYPGLRYAQSTAGCRVRVGQFSPYVARIVVESGTRMHVQTHSFPLASGYKIQIVMNQTSPVSVRQVYTPPPKPAPLARMPFYRGAKRKIVVVIDPGHGGKDPGASGYHKTLEKHVVLAISKRLQQKINRQPGMVAVLTRDGDYFIDLRRRLDISRRYHPDIFVAIHADAFTNTQSHGASVFALSQRGATSEAARWLAEKENYSELGGVNLKGLNDKTGVIRSVLIDLSQTATIHASLKIGANVLRYLGRMTTLHNHRVEQARFVVLKSPDTPSILVETGFISNPLEEQRLASSAYQEKLSQAIFDGIYQYFREYPPRGTQLR